MHNKTGSDIITNEKIAKNTLMLYIRMFFVMAVSLYTVRIVLNILGETDYGIYNVVGGIIVMLSFFNKTFASAAQRFFAYELGKKDDLKLNSTFCVLLLLFIIMSIIVVFISETIGLWFLNNKMTIPEDRINVARWLFQFSVASFVITLMAIPYQALIIAHEEMNVYAFMGILEALLLLTSAFILYVTKEWVDSLLLYGLLALFSVLITQPFYYFYTRRHYKETKFHFCIDKDIFRHLFSYCSWTIFGTTAGLVRSHGINLLINTFFCPAINAARGIAYQVNNAINHFASNFHTAVKPQITKLYARQELKSAFSLVNKSSKLSFFLLLFLATPISVFAEQILSLWLVYVPDYTILFLRLVIIIALIDSLSNSLMTLAQATGNIALYQFVVGMIMIMNLPLSWLFLFWGYPPQYTLFVAIVLSFLALLGRLYILKRIVNFPVYIFFVSVLFRVLLVSLISLASNIIVYIYIYNLHPSLFIFISSLILCIVLSVLIIWIFGLDKSEKQYVCKIVEERILRRY